MSDKGHHANLPGDELYLTDKLESRLNWKHYYYGTK